MMSSSPSGWKLVASTDLNDENAWIQVEASAVSGNNFLYTESSSGPRRFFRLIRNE
jgi:hypothetical protein